MRQVEANGIELEFKEAFPREDFSIVSQTSTKDSQEVKGTNQSEPNCRCQPEESQYWQGSCCNSKDEHHESVLSQVLHVSFCWTVDKPVEWKSLSLPTQSFHQALQARLSERPVQSSCHRALLPVCRFGNRGRLHRHSTNSSQSCPSERFALTLPCGGQIHLSSASRAVSCRPTKAKKLCWVFGDFCLRDYESQSHLVNGIRTHRIHSRSLLDSVVTWCPSGKQM